LPLSSDSSWGEFFGVLEDQVADPPDDPAALGRRHAAPRAVVECLAGSLDGPVDVLSVAFRDVRQRGRRSRGFGVSKVLPEAASVHWPLMKRLAGGAGELLYASGPRSLS